MIRDYPYKERIGWYAYYQVIDEMAEERAQAEKDTKPTSQGDVMRARALEERDKAIAYQRQRQLKKKLR